MHAVNGAVANVVVDAAADLAIDAVVDAIDVVPAHVNRLTLASCVTALHHAPATFVRMAVVVALALEVGTDRVV